MYPNKRVGNDNRLSIIKKKKSLAILLIFVIFLLINSQLQAIIPYLIYQDQQQQQNQANAELQARQSITVNSLVNIVRDDNIKFYIETTDRLGIGTLITRYLTRRQLQVEQVMDIENVLYDTQNDGNFNVSSNEYIIKFKYDILSTNNGSVGLKTLDILIYSKSAGDKVADIKFSYSANIFIEEVAPVSAVERAMREFRLREMDINN